ncbi:hypothetical protein SAMN05192529_1041 [Arachidicoccus rhizosphaerae]|jgi:hypothetical protein|uniref:Uncharacterized protein n=1 Tax=Arachidicoccus rhizosphaerae TaxID=551991 RepID=A0A1H3WW93_9BACT|nr:hypothetical protein [Arachidicoccus rhizosphaerae]SDZ90654.1 hypothetical protein SAMN05192529_1041 [Arachidicoccus rhizosphaerae]
MQTDSLSKKRIVLVHWKKQQHTEVFSNLRNFCLSYPEYSYNTLNNYLGKEKTAYDNETVRVERKEIITKPKVDVAASRAIAPVLRRVKMKQAEDQMHDWHYWISQPVIKRAEAVTFLVNQMLKKGQRMDKTIVNKIKTDYDTRKGL